MTEGPCYLSGRQSEQLSPPSASGDIDRTTAETHMVLCEEAAMWPQH